jgi:hypothetical protein
MPMSIIDPPPDKEWPSCADTIEIRVAAAMGGRYAILRAILFELGRRTADQRDQSGVVAAREIGHDLARGIGTQTDDRVADFAPRLRGRTDACARQHHASAQSNQYVAAGTDHHKNIPSEANEAKGFSLPCGSVPDAASPDSLR